MTPIAPAMTPPRPPTDIAVLRDGKLVGHVRSLQAPALVARLRDIKAAKLAEEESLPEGAHTIMLDVSANKKQPIPPPPPKISPALQTCMSYLKCFALCEQGATISLHAKVTVCTYSI